MTNPPQDPAAHVVAAATPYPHPAAPRAVVRLGMGQLVDGPRTAPEPAKLSGANARRGGC